MLLSFLDVLVYHLCICCGEMFIQVCCLIFISLILWPFVLSLRSFFNIYILGTILSLHILICKYCFPFFKFFTLLIYVYDTYMHIFIPWYTKVLSFEKVLDVYEFFFFCDSFLLIIHCQIQSVKIYFYVYFWEFYKLINLDFDPFTVKLVHNIAWPKGLKYFAYSQLSLH